MSSSNEENHNNDDTGTTRRSLPSAKKTNDKNKASASRNLSRDEQADLELQEFLAALNSERDTTTTTTTATAKTTTTSSSKPSSASTTTTTSSISPEALYPTEMSCRQAFDSAFYCQSPGGQFINVYRYGGLRDCGESWAAFWFCMRTKGYPDVERQRRIREFYRQRDRKYRIGPSSEDVWDMRTKPVLNAFSKTPPSETAS